MTHSLRKILHVDDDAVMRLMTKKALERAHLDFNIISCATGHELLECIDTFQPDILLVDYIMPIMDGEELMMCVRNSHSSTKDCPVVFISGIENISFRNHDALEPILGIIKKPFAPTTLGHDLLGVWEKFKLNQV
ncbi:MAG: response regulator [Pseudomonadota bacterium]